MPWRGPEFPGEVPTLGWVVLRWIREFLIVPDGPGAGEPLALTREQAQFVLNFYALDPMFEGPVVRGATLQNARRVRRAIYSRPKGAGKSPLLAALCLAEALAPVLLDGWDAQGEPVGREWSSLGFKARTQIIAVSEDQTSNTWDPLLEMARGGPVLDAYDIEPMESFVNVPRGRVEFTTSSALSREGGRPVFAAMDQTESWLPSNGGTRLAATVRRNLAKVQGSSVEAPNAYVPGDNSVAEKSFEAHRMQVEGRLKGDGGILRDHREAPADTDPEDRDSLLAGMAVAYGDSADVNGGWVNLERVVADYWDPDTDPQDARRFFLNQVTHASDAWLSSPEWSARFDVDRVVTDGEAVTLGFDGSRRRNRGVTDATALVGCCVEDGHLFEVGVWEQPPGPVGREWEIPRPEVTAAVRAAFNRWRVVGFFADPAKWETEVAGWEASYGRRLQVKSSVAHPVEWWMTGGRTTQVVKAVDALGTAIREGQMTHDGSHALTRHMLNARRRVTPAGVTIGKEHPDSARKIDAAVAAVLAFEARRVAVAKGLARPRRQRRAVGF